MISFNYNLPNSQTSTSILANSAGFKTIITLFFQCKCSPSYFVISFLPNLKMQERKYISINKKLHPYIVDISIIASLIYSNDSYLTKGELREPKTRSALLILASNRILKKSHCPKPHPSTAWSWVDFHNPFFISQI